MAKPEILHFTPNVDANRYLATEPLALLLGMLLDQQVPMERAVLAPWDLRERLGGTIDAAAIAAMNPDDLVAVFSQRPALHRFPGSMAKRVHQLCQSLVEDYDGKAERLWDGVDDADELFKRLRALPGFGEEKSRIFVGLLGRRLGVRPQGWEAHAPDWPTIADVDSPGAIERVREAKRARKAALKKG